MRLEQLGEQFRHRPNHYDGFLAACKHLAARQVKRRVLGVVTCQLKQRFLRRAINNPANVGLVSGSGAHGAGLKGGDQRALPQIVSAVVQRGCAG